MAKEHSLLIGFQPYMRQPSNRAICVWFNVHQKLQKVLHQSSVLVGLFSRECLIHIYL